MLDKENRDIIDLQGNILKSTKENKIKDFLVTNIWKIFGTGFATVTTMFGMFSILVSKGYSISCANFYGIDRRYFTGTEIFEDKMIGVLCALILFSYPFIFSYLTKRIKSKASTIVTFFLTIIILFVQNLIYTLELVEKIPWEWMIRYIYNNVTFGIFFVSDVLIAYFIIIRELFFEKNMRKLKRLFL